MSYEYKFNVGDKVEVVKNGRGMNSNHIGLTFTVRRQGEYCEGPGYELEETGNIIDGVSVGNGASWDFMTGEETFKLVERATLVDNTGNELLSEIAALAELRKELERRTAELTKALEAVGLQLLGDSVVEKEVLTLLAAVEAGTVKAGQKVLAGDSCYTGEHEKGSHYIVLGLDSNDEYKPVHLTSEDGLGAWLPRHALSAYTLVS